MTIPVLPPEDVVSGGGGSAGNSAFLLDNATIICSRSGNAETFSLKTAAGTNPSAADPVRVAFVNASGGYDILERTSALSFTFTSGSTGGAIANLAFKVCVLLLNNAGVLDMGVVVRPSGIRDNSIVSTTAEGGAGGADSPRVIYSATALTDVRCRVLGYATYTLATPGTWNTAPSEILLTRAGAVEIQVKELLYEKTLTANGVFDTNEWWPSGTLPSSGYDSYEFVAELRGSVSATNDPTNMYFNNDITLTNYRSAESFGGSTSGGSVLDAPRVGPCCGSTSTAGDFAVFLGFIDSPGNTTKRKGLITSMGVRYDATTIFKASYYANWESTAAINRIQLSPDGYNWGTSTGDQFVSGSSLKLYGLKTMTVLM